MKILFFTDPHWCQYSSIIRSNGIKYSTRLENLIKSLNWVEQISKENNCALEICGGDFFDKAELTAQEITALSDIKWNDINKIFIVGNHEIGINDASLSTAHLFNLLPNVKVISSPTIQSINDTTELAFLPYILESNKESLESYFGQKNKKRIIFSHNDIAGIQLGQWLTTTGFNIDDIENNADLFINGHLHNGSYITDKILNVGSLIGLNFSEDAFTYKHNVIIIDTETLKIDFIENPYAFNFFKINNSNKVFDLSSLGPNTVVTVQATEKTIDEYKKQLSNKNIVASRLLLKINTNILEDKSDELTIDHLQKFKSFILETLGTDDIVQSELLEVTK